eukprot:15467597-Alexandrium_andersonii.AAC.1
MAAAPAGDSSPRGPAPSKVICRGGSSPTKASTGEWRGASTTSGSPARMEEVAWRSRRQPPRPRSLAAQRALEREGRSAVGRGHQPGPGGGQAARGAEPWRE